jgi:hypothetical protein
VNKYIKKPCDDDDNPLAHDAALRCCLKCGRMFKSAHRFNKQCKNCKITNDKSARDTAPRKVVFG